MEKAAKKKQKKRFFIVFSLGVALFFAGFLMGRLLIVLTGGCWSLIFFRIPWNGCIAMFLLGIRGVWLLLVFLDRRYGLKD